MSQLDVYDLLKSKSRKWYTVKELCVLITNIEYFSIGLSCKKLYKSGFVDRRIKHTGKHAPAYEYRYKKA